MLFIIVIIINFTSIIHLLSFVLWWLKISFFRFRSSHLEVFQNISLNDENEQNKQGHEKLIHVRCWQGYVSASATKENYQRKLGFFMPLPVSLWDVLKVLNEF